MVGELCHCGKPLHYESPILKKAMMRQVARLGPTVLVETPDGAYIVPRHYIALHGGTGTTVGKLGFPRADGE